MSVYALQKLIRDVNRRPDRREAYFQSPATFAEGYDLAERERDALLRLDMGALYGMGVHGLLLRPFTILHNVAEADYLKAIRGE
jgi:Aromatic-ring-opening dioxygenase LigAB, LigA subunit